MLDMFKLKLEYRQNDDLDTVSYVAKMTQFINFFKRQQIIFSTEKENVNKKLIHNLITAYFGTLECREDSLFVDIEYISHSQNSVINNVAHMCLQNNATGTLIYQRMDKM